MVEMVGTFNCPVAGVLQVGKPALIRSFLDAAQNQTLPSAPILDSPSMATRSYVDVVKGGGFYGARRCDIKTGSHGQFIEVVLEGISEK
ncbi:unnamed protein product [Linum trigynum]|uniref:Uncharacterized protein n=1 Tax=Linum trigynum TaxID=586398 RepID=A0AAV2G8T2_9ROSI